MFILNRLQPQARVNAIDALSSLATNMGTAVILSDLAPYLGHRNWRIREGVLRFAAKFAAEGQVSPLGWPTTEYLEKVSTPLLAMNRMYFYYFMRLFAS